MDNTLSAVFRLIDSLKVQIPKKDLKAKLTSHINYPSLLAVGDVLKEYNIENNCYQIQINDFESSSFPFLAHLKGDKLTVVKKIDDHNITVIGKENKDINIPKEEFSSYFSGTVLIPKLNINSGDPSYIKNTIINSINSFKTPLSLSILALILIYLLLSKTDYFENLSFRILLLTLIKFIGLFISTTLLFDSVHMNSSVMHRICYISKSDCNSVLSSSASKLFWDQVSLAEIGFFYYFCTFLLLIFNSGSQDVLNILVVINLCSLPFTLFSIYYQGLVIKKWCVFCCLILLLLWLEASQLIFFSNLFHFQNLTASIKTTSIYFVIPVLIWIIIKPLLLKIKEGEDASRDLQLFQNNEALFNSFMNIQIQYKLLGDNDSIVWGNLKSSTTITLVINPYCNPCKTAIATLDKWLEHEIDFKLQLVFASPKEELPRHVIANLSSDYNYGIKSIKDWNELDSKEYSKWAITHKLHEKYSPELCNEIVRKQEEWSDLVQIKHTPTILINGRKLPDIYELENIKYFI